MQSTDAKKVNEYYNIEYWCNHWEIHFRAFCVKSESRRKLKITLKTNTPSKTGGMGIYKTSKALPFSIF